MSILRQSLWPVSEWRDIKDFTVALEEAPLGCLTAMKETISAHQSHRTHSDVERSGDRCYLLFANRLPWAVAHNGHNEQYDCGDSVLVDSQGELETSAPYGFRGLIFKLPVDWVDSWLPNPDLLVGSRIARDSRWGKTFSPIISQLTPDFVSAPCVPPSVLVDQVGALLGLMAGEADANETSRLLQKIRDRIRERCSEPQLTAADVAASLNLPSRTLHRVLAANKLTFAPMLIDARVSVALQMLTAPSVAHLTISAIALKSGFLSDAHFMRAIRKRTGHSPQELWRLTH
jgi:AraC-like DNA-binding protein